MARRKRKTSTKVKGAALSGDRIYKSAVPKTGSVLTRERISRNLRSLNSGK